MQGLQLGWSDKVEAMVAKYRCALMREKILRREISVLAEENGNLQNFDFKYQVASKSGKSMERLE